MSPSPPPAVADSTTEQPPLPPGTPPPAVEAEESAETTGTAAAASASAEDESEPSKEGADEEATEDAAPGVHKGKAGWTAVWDPARAAYYFFNTLTNEVTWQNPLEGDASSGNAEASTSAAPAEDQGPDLGGIDPELAFLDPTLKRQLQGGSGATPAFQARFNSRTGRFQGDPSMNPDRISDYQRANRQQEVFYDTTAWTESLQGKGLKRSGGAEGENGARKKKATAAEVAAFKKKKEDKKRAKLMDFLKS